jgi:CheY-like chemotaxis protein
MPRILVIDDNVECREIMRFLLESDGYSVVRTADGQEALDWLHQNELPCLILLDLSMPVMDGWQFRHEQQQDPVLTSIPVLLLSGEVNLSEHAATMHTAGYFTKPVCAFDSFLEAVHAVAPDARKSGLS